VNTHISTVVYNINTLILEDFGVLLVWGYCGDSHRFFISLWDGMGKGIEIESKQQP